MIRRLLRRLHHALFPRITDYDILPAAAATMAALSRQTHPKEAFGVLRGRRRGHTIVVEEVVFQPFTNTTRSASVVIDEYAIDGLVGTFHSHPTPDARPSAADKRLFGTSGGLHCIAPFPYRSVHAFNGKGQRLGVHALVHKQ